ncbi:MAG TPA: tRNA dihydrouridine(20/20a) synthase DusA [Micavibrio sp.]|nr:tRNA dihydrouridine(20/20a) synthase DusA [Micavibrio sp.]
MKHRKPHISVAPMMDWTDRHCRYFHRLLSPNVRLYTEMVTTGALLHGDVDRHLRFNAAEKYVALQLGGSEPDDLAACAKMGEDYGYDEINLNCGCPSERVQKGAFGACLMAEPDLVARCVESMTKAVKIPVTVKCRISIDEYNPETFLRAFIKPVVSAGCGVFVIHARKAWLKGLSPKENRTVPPIDYALPAAIRAEYPGVEIVINGEIKTPEQAKTHLQTFDGAMIGREAYHNPGLLLDLEKEIFGNANPRTPHEAVLAMIPYIEQQARDHGTPMKSITRHMIGLFRDERGSRKWRRNLSEISTHPHADNPQVFIEQALEPMCG